MIPSSQLQFSQGMWRVEIAGKHYCAQTLELLKTGLNLIGIAVTEPPVFVSDDRTQAEVLVDILHQPSAPLSEKQAALLRLTYLANAGDVLAEEIIKLIPAERSKEAKYFTKQIGKTDFLFCTYEELTEYVDNVVLRSKLITELGKLYARL